jgi:hypothetical protein
MKNKLKYFWYWAVCFFTHSHSSYNREIVHGKVKRCLECGKFHAPFGESIEVKF